MLKSILARIGFSGARETHVAQRERALTHLMNGQVEKAISLLEELLRDSAGDADSHNLLGRALLHADRLTEARKHIEEAISLDPAGLGYHCNLADLLFKQGETANAERAYRTQIERTPGFGEAYMALVNFLSGLNREQDALKVCQQALKALPEFDEAAVHLAIHEQNANKNYARSMALVEPVLKRHPNHAMARLVAARAHMFSGKYASAEALLRSVLKDEPDNISALLGLGYLLLIVTRGEDAEACFRLVLGIDPDNVTAAQFLASQLIETGKLDQAGDLLAVFSHQYPDNPVFTNCLGRIALQSGNTAEAIEHFERALETNPKNISCIEQLANIHSANRRPEEAIKLFRHALTLAPKRHLTHYNYGMALLKAGNFRQGLIHYETRLKIAYEEETPYSLRQVLYKPQEAVKHIAAWDGKTSLKGKRLLVWREQGFGDFLMMMRFLPELRKLGAHVTLLAPKELLRLSQEMKSVDEVILTTEWIPGKSHEYDFTCSIMSLPYLLGATIGSLSKQNPYLHVPVESIEHARAMTASPQGEKKLRVGLVWAGSATLSVDKERSLSLQKLEPLFAIPSIEWISLQKGNAQSELEGRDWPIMDVMDQCEDFFDTAALVMTLDLVISVDTSVVHLAGALGKPIWMFNRASSEWRWMLNREDSPWYPTLRLFNQELEESWETVVARTARALQEYSA